MMKTIPVSIIFFCMVTAAYGQQTAPNAPDAIAAPEEQVSGSQWQGKRVAFLGDSMTQESRPNKVYWKYLSEWMGIEPHVYGISGHQWTGIYGQALKLLRDGTAVDAIFIFAGTNDFNHGVPLGEFFTEALDQTNHNGNAVVRKHRTPIESDSTFCGRINKVMSFLKTNFPEQQIIIMTPVHRGYAKFSDNNVQPDENYANGQNLYLDEYVETLKKAAGYWSVPLIDLHSLSGLYPLADSHSDYFRNAETDLLHLNSKGNQRLAKTIMYQLLSLPSTFVSE